jgi:hypothetical protein
MGLAEARQGKVSHGSKSYRKNVVALYSLDFKKGLL